MIKPNDAREIARRLLEHEFPRRWAHTQGVAERARSLADVLGEDSDLIETAAWLHDIGYAQSLSLSGFHSLDGARYLRCLPDVPEAVCQLVAHHTGAAIEAEERGMPAVCDEFEAPPAGLLDALTYCDLRTAVDGVPTTVDERIAEILARYPADHVVHRSVRRSAPQLRHSTRSMQVRVARGRSVEVGR
ncbi:HD domain-containing protein [Kribbella sp. NPDC050459]|uniref:HD domain-containing protein n=1 Tax=Kribbella sp. NPDC050459 TaxID=3155785 RepID=UPI0033FA1076